MDGCVVGSDCIEANEEDWGNVCCKGGYSVPCG
jgi:hypothetical protein